ncbi:MAG: sigma-70 family RNA polymerase sigma factor [Candidatus Latescibacteria bacterium]|nr:sigma-70 family RNA polymerase sigma factor [Candidatus Latescibacterota bacterium]
MALEDQTLVRLVLDGQREVFGVLVERYSGLVYSLILEQVRRREDVEDLVQEAFCQAYQQLPDLRRPASFPAWLAQITRSTTLMWLRREGYRTQVEALGEPWTWPASPPMPDRLLESQEEAELLWGVLDRLPATQRQVVVLFYLENCTYREIARFLGKSVAVVRWHLFQSERRLGKELGQRLGEQWRPERTDRRHLRGKVLATLPVGLWVSTRGEAAPWWTLPPVLRWLSHGTLVSSFLGSMLLHLLGIGALEYWWWEESGSRPGVRVMFQGEAVPPTRFAGRADLPIRPQMPGPAQDLLSLAEFLGLFSPPSLGRLGPGFLERAMLPEEGDLVLAGPWSAGKVRSPRRQSTAALFTALPAAASMDSLPPETADPGRVESLDQSGTPHAVVIADSLDRRQLQGELHLTGVRVSGSGSYSAPGHALADLARYLSDHTRLRVRIQNPHFYNAFLSAELLSYPIHFLFQEGGWPAWQDRQVLSLEPEESALLGKYLRQGGFVYAEGGPVYLQSAIEQVRLALGGQGRLREIPLGHPLYHAFYDFDSGFPGEAKRQADPEPGQGWDYPAGGDLAADSPPLGLWGVELDGEVVALFNDSILLNSWPDEVADQESAGGTPVKSLRLMAATNVVVYALTRPHSLARVLVPVR